MATDDATVLRGIQLDQENIIDDQNLILETLTFVLNLLAENRETAADLNRRLDEVFLMLENVNEIESRSEFLEQELRVLNVEVQMSRELYETALEDQTNFFNRLIDRLNEKHRKSVARISESLAACINKSETQLQQTTEMQTRLDEFFASLDETADRLKEELARHRDQTREFMSSIDERNRELARRLNDLAQDGDGVQKYLSLLEELMRLIAANQLLKNDVRSKENAQDDRSPATNDQRGATDDS